MKLTTYNNANGLQDLKLGVELGMHLKAPLWNKGPQVFIREINKIIELVW